MDDRLARFLGELHGFGVRHDADRADRLDRLRNLEPESARLLALLVRVSRAAEVLELGTSNGFSTLWLADALNQVAGRLTSVEIDPERSAVAAQNLREVGLDHLVELRVADAGDVLAKSPDDAWDLIFLDAERPAYVGYWPQLRRVLRPGGLLVVDNVVSHADQVADFRALVEADPGVFEALAPSGAGLLLMYAAARPARA